MKPSPAPYVLGHTAAERFDNAVRKIFTVSKEDLLKEEAKWKRARAKKRSKKKADSQAARPLENLKQLRRAAGNL